MAQEGGQAMNKNSKIPVKNSTVIALLSFALFLVLFYWKVLFEGNVFVFVDASRFFFPIWKWGSAVFNQGLIPLWNPDAVPIRRFFFFIPGLIPSTLFPP
jgi:hypothetical protein